MIYKNKGISLLILIITIVVVIILTTSIIVNMTKTGLISSSNEAVFKQDLSNLNDELQLYHNEKFIDSRGKYNPEFLDSDYKGTYYNDELQDISIYNILSKLRDSKLDGIAYIQNGELVLDRNSLTDKEKEWSENIGITINGKPIIKNISVEADKMQISVNVEVSESSKISKYKYRINENDWVETEQSTYTFENLQVTTKYKVSVIVVSESGDESDIYEEEVYTFGNEQDLQIVPETSEYVAQNLKVEINYSSDIPEGYKLQYRLTKENGTVVEQDWVSYDSNIGIILNKNVVITARIYNSSIEDELVSASKAISTIDTEIPTKPTNISIVPLNTKLTVQARGSTDTISGLKGYKYSIDNGINWTDVISKDDSYTFSGIKSSTEVEVLAKAVDNVLRESEIYSSKGSTTEITAPTLNVELENSINGWTKTKAIGTLSGTVPEGYELQYKLTKENGTVVVQDWTKYTGQIDITENGITIIGRVYNSNIDDEVVSSPASNTISNIDTLAPNEFTPCIKLKDDRIEVYAASTYGGIATDKIATSTSGCSGIEGYAFSYDSGSTYSEYQLSNIYEMIPGKGGVVFKNIRIKIIDKAGNETVVNGPEYVMQEAINSSSFYRWNNNIDRFVKVDEKNLQVNIEYPIYGINYNYMYESDGETLVSEDKKTVYRFIDTPGGGTSNRYALSEGFVSNKTISVTSVALNQTSASIHLNSSDTITLTETIFPLNASNKNVTWESSNTSVATVSNGVVTAVAPGVTTITVATVDGNKTASATVTVNKNVVIIIGASQVYRMVKYVGSYTSTSTNYNYNTEDGTLVYLYKSATGHDYQTETLFPEAENNYVGKYKNAKPYTNIYIYFPLAGNTIANYSCDEISSLNSDIIQDAQNYFNCIKKMKDEGYNVKGYVVSVHPVTPEHEQAVNKNVVYNTSDNALQSVYRSNWKYNKYNIEMSKIINNNFSNYDYIEYISLFEQIMNVTDNRMEEFSFKIQYNTTDSIHWDASTTQKYVNMMLEYTDEL